MTDLRERVAVLEAEVEALKGVPGQLDEIHKALAKYQGFWGGVMLVGSAIVVCLTFAKDWIVEQIR